MESRLSDRKLKPLPPDPARHQDSAIAQFPTWQDIDELLQYTYYHVDVQIPSARLVSQSPEQLQEVFNMVLQAEHEMMKSLSVAIA
jgi:hypothetical protein